MRKLRFTGVGKLGWLTQWTCKRQASFSHPVLITGGVPLCNHKSSTLNLIIKSCALHLSIWLGGLVVKGLQDIFVESFVNLYLHGTLGKENLNS